jgi:hypothetical protein
LLAAAANSHTELRFATQSGEKGEKVEKMTTISHQLPADAARPRSWLGLEVMWGSLAIIVIWLAVLFDAVFGPDMRLIGGSNATIIPSAVLVALFAVIATTSIAKRVFKSEG